MGWATMLGNLDPYPAEEVGVEPYVLDGVFTMQISRNACGLELSAEDVRFLRGGADSDSNHIRKEQREKPQSGMEH
jgi:hypothetical protein